MIHVTQYRVDIQNISFDILNSEKFLMSFMQKVIDIANLTVLFSHFHTFSPQGITGIFILSESHFCVHTWPETWYAIFDLLSCSDEQQTLATLDLFKYEFWEWNIQIRVQSNVIG